MNKTYDMGDIVCLHNKQWGVCIQRDYAKNEVLFKLFQSKEEAIKFLHDVSLEQCPDWHKENCDVCKP